jgi:hypothetical protein
MLVNNSIIHATLQRNFHLAISSDLGMTAVTELSSDHRKKMTTVDCVGGNMSLDIVSVDGTAATATTCKSQENDWCHGHPGGGCFTCRNGEAADGNLQALITNGIVPSFNTSSIYTGTASRNNKKCDVFKSHWQISASGISANTNTTWMFASGSNKLLHYMSWQHQEGGQTGSQHHYMEYSFFNYTTNVKPASFAPPAGITCTPSL